MIILLIYLPISDVRSGGEAIGGECDNIQNAGY